MMPFTFETFVERRGPEPVRVWHPVGDPNDWIALRNRYNDRIRKSLAEEPAARYNGIHEPMYASVGPDLFQVLIHKYGLNVGILEWSHAWIGFKEPGANNRVWVRIDDDDLAIKCHTQAPWEHQVCDNYTVRGFINCRTERQILDEIQRDVGIARWLMDYRDEFPEYEVTVSVPQAETMKYDCLREKLCAT